MVLRGRWVNTRFRITMAIAICLKCKQEVHWRAGRGAKLQRLVHRKGRDTWPKGYTQPDHDGAAFCGGDLKGGSLRSVRDRQK